MWSGVVLWSGAVRLGMRSCHAGVAATALSASVCAISAHVGTLLVSIGRTIAIIRGGLIGGMLRSAVAADQAVVAVAPAVGLIAGWDVAGRVLNAAIAANQTAVAVAPTVGLIAGWDVTRRMAAIRAVRMWAVRSVAVWARTPGVIAV